jgi:hypothetical protein
MNERVVIQRVKRGHVVKSFDLSTNIYEFFKGPWSLTNAKMHCLENRYEIVNAAGYGKLPKQLRQDK